MQNSLKAAASVALGFALALTLAACALAFAPLMEGARSMPLVIFAPRDVEVRHRVWRAGREIIAR